MHKKPDNSKKSRLYNSRAIRTQLVDSSFVDNEKLSIPEFLKSRSYEIKSFELSQLNTKRASSNRVFQSLPRTLRRRAASHNVKRIPKRLRSRAIREMKNAVHGVNPKSHHLRGRNLYKLRMSKKLLRLGSKLKLSKHLPPEEALGKNLRLRYRIALINKYMKDLNDEAPTKLNNCVGSYDNTGINNLASRPKGNLKYFKRQFEFVWLPSHIWHAKRFHMIKQHNFQIPLTPTQKCFRLMNRAKKSGSVLSDMSYYNTLILQIEDTDRYQNILLSLTKYKVTLPRKFLQGSKSYDDLIFVDGLVIGKGLIISNFSLKKILIRVFPSIYEMLFEYLKLQIHPQIDLIYDCRYSLASIEICGPTALNSLSKVLHLDPYKYDSIPYQVWYILSHLSDSDSVPVGTTFSFYVDDPRFWKNPVEPKANTSFTSVNDLIIKITESDLVNSQSLMELLDNKKRNETYANQLSLKKLNYGFAKSNPNENLLEHDPVRIPVLITKGSSGSWLLILPWFWLMPLWFKLVKIAHLKVGGLRQRRQFNFEKLLPTFPNDLPYLKDGWVYNQTLGRLNEESYKRLPKSKQQKYEIFENGINPFKCDWSFLQLLIFGLKLVNKELKTTDEYSDYNENGTRNINTVNDLVQLIKAKREEDAIPIELLDLTRPFHRAFVDGSYTLTDTSSLPKLPVVHISLKVLNRGIIRDNARLYAVSNASVKSYMTQKQEIVKPLLVDLIGFVTSGAFNLDYGADTGLCLVRADYKGDFFLVRNPGCSNMYLAQQQ
ncbi:uncharacterized protein PRCAT00003201001 [Priceomyces carsonii]|uniref:uncharacterized protein n=1 Tax=Priceomyces carsonii TaxID=28549 RepID=UPI002EDB2697|nr:unnamed protein product [Priceomyces carsonii]